MNRKTAVFPKNLDEHLDEHLDNDSEHLLTW